VAVSGHAFPHKSTWRLNELAAPRMAVIITCSLFPGRIR
jgi:hypothetical protein